ncbi:MAG: ribbon-helix-helix protein, CopG family [Solirubrobacterales bacterium]|nr:ribbon-helix-helix protein, CopG family [Solirubrobacterales bacterium]
MSRLLSVSLPDELADEIDSLVETSGKTRSELVRDALRRQIRLERVYSVRHLGQSRAEAAGIGPEDVEDLIDRFRSE